LHWGEARRGFLLQVMGAVLLAVGSLAANDSASSRLTRAASNGAEGAQDKTESALKAKEAEVRASEQDLATLQTKLNADYEALKARRVTLGTDAAALAAFNKDAATYTAEKTDLSVKAGRLAQLRADVVRLTDQLFLEAREKAKLDPKSGFALVAQREPARAATPRPISVSDGDVIMYTTRHCPACLAAKQYLARRGVTYKEFDVETSGGARADFDKLGGHAVPLIIVKGRQMVGFDQAELEKLL